MSTLERMSSEIGSTVAPTASKLTTALTTRTLLPNILRSPRTYQLGTSTGSPLQVCRIHYGISAVKD